MEPEENATKQENNDDLIVDFDKEKKKKKYAYLGPRSRKTWMA